MILLFDDIPTDPTTKARDRSREGAGKSERSWLKHKLVRQAVGAQLAAFRIKHKGRILLIDGNAGDGHGVELPQSDLFGDNPSCATAEMMAGFAAKDGDADVVLCEADATKRAALAQAFPEAVVLADHADAPSVLRREHIFAIWLSDPCGPSAHGVAHMRSIADRVRSDFVVVFNEGWIVSRCSNTKSAHWAPHRAKYMPMVPPQWWADALGRAHVARTKAIINGAPNFRYRVLTISDHLTQGAMREPFEVAL